MQSTEDHGKAFVCSECTSNFASASLLLKHFAHHILCSSKNGSQAQFSKTNSQEGKSGSILEQVLQKNYQMSDTDSQNFSSSLSEHGSSTSCNDASLSEQDGFIPQSVLDLSKKVSSKGSPTSDNNIMLVKFDLQKRLENCILKLVSKRDSSLDASSRSIKIEPVLAESKSKASVPEITISLARTNGDFDDFNPLKFCVVTMEEGDDNLDLASPTVKQEEHITAKTNRKQRSPKKLCGNDKAEILMEALQIAENDSSHPTRKKYPCNICWKVFGWSTDLKRHILTHTGERPFKCQSCPATFTRNFLLQKHRAKSHANSEPECRMKTYVSKATVLKSTQSFSPKKKRKLQRVWNNKQGIMGRKLQAPIVSFQHRALDIS